MKGPRKTLCRPPAVESVSVRTPFAHQHQKHSSEGPTQKKGRTGCTELGCSRVWQNAEANPSHGTRSLSLLSALLAWRWALSSGWPPPVRVPGSFLPTLHPTSRPHVWCHIKIKELLSEDRKWMLVKEKPEDRKWMLATTEHSYGSALLE